MKTWKITNTSNQPIKISLKTSSSTSKGVIIPPNEFCVALPQLTAPMDAQKRKGFITVDEKYENPMNLELGVNYKVGYDITITREQAEKDAIDYMKKS